jgi:hypothetical protein
MWPTSDIWTNTLMLAAGGAALILAGVLGQSEGGRRIMKAASIALCM